MLKEDSVGFLNLVREIFQTHDPTWADIQSLLSVLLTGEEKGTVFSKAQEEADKEHDLSCSVLCLLPLGLLKRLCPFLHLLGVR